MKTRATRVKVLLAVLLAFLAGAFLLLNTAPDAMAVVGCVPYCADHDCSGTCYCSTLSKLTTCRGCPGICDQ